MGIAVIEPSEQHYYEPLWTLVGAGEVAKERTVRPEGSVIPNGVTWIREAVVGFESYCWTHSAGIVSGSANSSFPMAGRIGTPATTRNTCQHSRQLEDRRPQADEVRRHTGCTAAPEARELAHAISDIETSR